jgi:hypothetical protein
MNDEKNLHVRWMWTLTSIIMFNYQSHAELWVFVKAQWFNVFFLLLLFAPARLFLNSSHSREICMYISSSWLWCSVRASYVQTSSIISSTKQNLILRNFASFSLPFVSFLHIFSLSFCFFFVHHSRVLRFFWLDYFSVGRSVFCYHLL